MSALSAIQVMTTKGPTTVDLIASFPGLAVHRGLAPAFGYVITHVASGMNLNSAECVFSNNVKAIRAAREIAELADWTLPGPALGALKLGPRVREIARTYGGRRSEADERLVVLLRSLS